MAESRTMRMKQALAAQAGKAQLLVKPTLFIEEGALLIVPELLANRGIHRVLVATTPGFMRRGTLEPFFTLLGQEGIAVRVFSDIPADPDPESILACASAYREGRCEATVAIGGGSVMDCAKLAGACIARPEKGPLELAGTMKVAHRTPFFVAVPTTAGTGSEVTAAAVVTDPKSRRKYAVSDISLIPNVAVLDPELLASLPADMTAWTGMDALTHAVESYINRYGSRAAHRFARRAVALIFQNLPGSYQDGADLERRRQMLLASYFAGVAFTNAYVGYVHALAHGLGGRYHVQHGLANAVLLPLVLEEYGPCAEKRLAELARVIGCQGADDHDLAQAFIARIRELNRELDIPATLPQIDEADMGILALGAEQEGNPAYPVPVVWGIPTFERVLRNARGQGGTEKPQAADA